MTDLILYTLKWNSIERDLAYIWIVANSFTHCPGIANAMLHNSNIWIAYLTMAQSYDTNWGQTYIGVEGGGGATKHILWMVDQSTRNHTGYNLVKYSLQQISLWLLAAWLLQSVHMCMSVHACVCACVRVWHDKSLACQNLNFLGHGIQKKWKYHHCWYTLV